MAPITPNEWKKAVFSSKERVGIDRNTLWCSTHSNKDRPIKVNTLRLQCLTRMMSTEEANNPTTTNLKYYLRSCCICGVKQLHPCIAVVRFLSKTDD